MLEIQRLSELDKSSRKKILNRSSAKMAEVLEKVRPIIDRVAHEGDSAVAEFTERFDRVRISPEDFFVPPHELDEALDGLDPELRGALEICCRNIRAFHHDVNAHLPKRWANRYSLGNGEWVCGIVPTPVDRAAGYVPGGTASYPSTALMVSVPAIEAGVKEFILTTPVREGGKIPQVVLAAAALAGVKRVLRVGGVQAIAALAYGTETIPQVDVIVGPGNIYVTAAKAYVSALGLVGIDFTAGPSEVVIIADDSANPESLAFELLAQAEHDKEAASVFLTDSEALAKAVREELLRRIPECERADIVEASLSAYGAILVCDSLDQAAEFSNEYAPEHLQIWVREDEKFLSKIRHAGSIFVGPWSPVAMGDYASGTNHVLPTGRAARFTSGLSVGTFMKYPTVQRLSRSGLEALCPAVAAVSRSEGFYSAHGRSAEQRLVGQDSTDDNGRFMGA